MAAGARTTIWSAIRPLVLSSTDWPLMGLVDPGPVSTQVTPVRRASRKSGSRGLTPSSARSWGVQGLVASFRSSPSQPVPVPYRPR